MKLTPKENYLMMLKGEIPEYVPSLFEMHCGIVIEDMLTPVTLPDGPVFSSFGVKYVGSSDIRNGAMPEPGYIILDDIRKWRDVIKKPDTSGRDWESYYKKQLDKTDRNELALTCNGSDYFITLVSFMGFENALMAMYEEPEEVYALFEYISEFYIEMMKREMYYCRPELYGIMDDDAAYAAPFYSLDMFRRLVKPFHKKHADIALDSGAMIERHDCGKSEQFIDDWIEMGVRSWNPAQVSNDLKAIKKKYVGKLAICGGWDNQGAVGRADVDKDVLINALEEYVDTFAPGGGFQFTAFIESGGDDKQTKERMDIIKEFYENKVRNYYKTH